MDNHSGRSRRHPPAAQVTPADEEEDLMDEDIKNEDRALTPLTLDEMIATLRDIRAHHGNLPLVMADCEPVVRAVREDRCVVLTDRC
jgi:hypothetical protein